MSDDGRGKTGLRWMVWVVAPVLGLVGAVAAGWLFDSSLFYGVVLAPAVTLMYAGSRLPPLKTLGAAMASLVVALTMVALAVQLLVLFFLDFSDIN